ncbi:hypothetical protein [Microvirga brassicacearum]|nr:hypothetical protein [Microvirga brassicacearum]
MREREAELAVQRARTRDVDEVDLTVVDEDKQMIPGASKHLGRGFEA